MSLADKTIKLSPTDALALLSNYDLPVLNGILRGSAPVLPTLKYTNADKEHTLEEVYFKLNITECLDRAERTPASLYTNQYMVATIDDRLIEAWGDEEIEEICLYVTSNNTEVDITVKDASVYGAEWDGKAIFSSIGNVDINIMAKTTDGRILTEYNWGRPSITYKNIDSTYKFSNGSPCWGYVYDIDESGYIFGSAFWSVGKSNCHVTSPYFATKQTSNLECSHKLFSSFTSAYTHLLTGSDEGEVDDGGGDMRDTDTERLFYRAKIYRSLSSTRSPKEEIDDVAITFKVQRYDGQGKEINSWRRAVFGVVQPLEGHYNIAFYKSEDFGKVTECTLNGEEISPSEFPFGECVATWHENDKGILYYYFANMDTNILIYDSMESARDDLNRLSGGDDGLDETEYNGNTVEFDLGMSDTYLLDSGEVRQLASIFNMNVDSDGAILSGMYVALSMHNNPIDVCIDLFALPVNCSGFVETDYTNIIFDIVSEDNE